MSIGRSMSRSPSRSRSRSRSGWAPWLFLAPALLVFTWFKFIPMVKGLVMSVHKVNFGGADTYQLVHKMLVATDSGCANQSACNVVDHTLMPYPLYW